MIESGEQCDDGNTDNGDGCSSTCQNEGGGGGFCGDGVKSPTEECDDGNNVDGDGCSAACFKEGGGGTGFCGDGVKSAVEQCDDGNNVDGDGCSAACFLEYFCGDGTIDQGEQCDDGNTTSGDGCSASCQNEGGGGGGPRCGDNILHATEQCDDGNTTSGDGCSASCVIEGGSSGSPTLTIDKTTALPFTNPGEIVEYTITYSNIGDITAFDVVVADSPAIGFTFASNGAASNSWDIGDLLPGETETITYEIAVGEDVIEGFYDNTALITATNHGVVYASATIEVRIPEVLGDDYEELPETGGFFEDLVVGIINNIVNFTNSITPAAKAEEPSGNPNLTITKQMPNFLNATGEVFESVIIIENTGTGSAYDVVVVDTPATGFTFTENNAPSNSWEIAEIKAGQKYVITAEMIANTKTAGGYNSTTLVSATNNKLVSATSKSSLRATQPSNDGISNRLIIPKINVDMPIVSGENGTIALLKGAWHMPGTGTPNKGNVVLAGHRFLRGPESANTLYRLDEMQVGDTFTAYWETTKTEYQITEIKVVDPDELEILSKTDHNQVTLFTCTPLYSTAQRLVVIAHPVVQEA